jgi:putative transposase
VEWFLREHCASTERIVSSYAKFQVRKGACPRSSKPMARKWSNQNLPGALHYVTGNVRDRIPVFKRGECCLAFLKVLRDLLHDWPSKLIAYVLMPDHIHLIVNPKDGRIQEFIGKLKGVAAGDIVTVTGGELFTVQNSGKGATHRVWQESFKAQPLWSAWMIWQKINYIHSNPVKAKLVKSAKDYRWSSFNAFYSGQPEPLAVDKDWWWPDDSEKLSKAMKELGWRTYHKRN